MTPHMTTPSSTGTHLYPVNLLSQLNSSHKDTGNHKQPEEASDRDALLVSPDEEEAQPEETEQYAMITCEFDAHDEMVEDKKFQSKAAIQISKAIGSLDVLQEFDKLRINLEKKSIIKGYQPLSSDKERHETVLSQVHTQVLSTKYRLKTDIKKFETNYYCKHGVLPNIKEDNCGELRNKLDYVRKI